MISQNYDLFLILVKIKSYLISLIDEPTDCNKDFSYTEEYLIRRYPDRLDEVLSLLKENDINCDSDIAFDINIHEKFKEITSTKQNSIDPASLFKNLEIDAENLLAKDEHKKERETKINIILKSLFQLAQNWSARINLDEDFDTYSKLDEEDMIRPNEQENLNKLDNYASLSYMNITLLTEKYIELLTDYYFEYGGDIALQDFVNDLIQVKDKVTKKYSDLFKKHGLDPSEIKRA